MITHEALKAFGDHLVKIAYSVQGYYVDKGGAVGSYEQQTRPGKGFVINKDLGQDRHGRNTYDRYTVYKKGTTDYSAAVSHLNKTKYGRGQLRRAGVIKRKKGLGIF